MSSSVKTEEFLARLRSVREQMSQIGASTIAGRHAAELLERLDVRLSRAPRIAILGEVNSGKSSLANKLIGSDLLSTDLIRNTRAPVLVRKSDSVRINLCRPNGDRLALTSANIASMALEPMDLIEVGVPFEPLQAREIIDTPGISFDEAGIARATRLVRMAHVAVWCTLATQAWRASEVAFWNALRTRIRRPVMLAVTHADMLSEADREKVLRRLQRDAGAAFDSIIMTGNSSPTSDGLSAIEAVAADVQTQRCRQASDVARRFAERITIEINERATRPKVPVLTPTTADAEGRMLN